MGIVKKHDLLEEKVHEVEIQIAKEISLSRVKLNNTLYHNYIQDLRTFRRNLNRLGFLQAEREDDTELTERESAKLDKEIPSLEAAALSPHENIVLGDVNIQLDSQNCWTDNFNTVLLDFDFIQHVSTPTHIQGHVLDVLCTSKSLTSSIHHYVKDGISDHLAVFFTTTFLRVKCLKIRKLGKINKTEFMSYIVNSELIQAPYKTASLLSHQ